MSGQHHEGDIKRCDMSIIRAVCQMCSRNTPLVTLASETISLRFSSPPLRPSRCALLQQQPPQKTEPPPAMPRSGSACRWLTEAQLYPASADRTARRWHDLIPVPMLTSDLISTFENKKPPQVCVTPTSSGVHLSNVPREEAFLPKHHTSPALPLRHE